MCIFLTLKCTLPICLVFSCPTQSTWSTGGRRGATRQKLHTKRCHSHKMLSLHHHLKPRDSTCVCPHFVSNLSGKSSVFKSPCSFNCTMWYGRIMLSYVLLNFTKHRPHLPLDSHVNRIIEGNYQCMQPCKQLKFWQQHELWSCKISKKKKTNWMLLYK